MNACDAEADEVEVALALRHRAADRAQHVGGVGLQLLQQRAGGEHEHARVPQVPAVAGEPGRLGGVRLLDELRHREGAGRIVERGADGDVAVASLRRGRAHAEGDEAAGARHRGGGVEAAVQRLGVGDHVVGGEQPQHRVGVVFGDQQRGGGDRGGAVAADRLQQDARRGDGGGAELFGDQEPVLLVADHDRRGEALATGAERGLLEHRVVGDQRPELLGKALAGDRPQAGAGAAGEDDGDDGGGGHGRGMCPNQAGRGQGIVRCRLSVVSIAGG